LWAFVFSCLGRGYAADRSEPLVVVQDGRYGYINQDGKVTIRPQFVWAGAFWRGLGTVYVCGRYASIDSSGALLPLRIAVEGRFEPEKKGEKFGFVDSSGRFRIAPNFDEVLPFSEGLAAVRSGDQWGFIDTSGNFAVPPRFAAAFYFREGVGTATLDSAWSSSIRRVQFSPPNSNPWT